MSFMNSMKKKAGELASMVMEDGVGDEPMRQEIDRIELSLQAQIKELKGFVTGMNSMCGAALAAGQIYRDEGGDGKLAAAVRRIPPFGLLFLCPAPLPRCTLLGPHADTPPCFCTQLCDAERTIAKDMIKTLATWLNTEVQRPTLAALERTKTCRAELSECARASNELESAERRMVGPQQLMEVREKLQSCEGHARQSLDELGVQVQELAARCVGGIVSCQRVMVHELGRLELRGQPERATLAALNQSAPPGWEDYLRGKGGTPVSPRRAESEPPIPRGRDGGQQEEQARLRAEAEAQEERERQRQRQQEHEQEKRRREAEADAASRQAAEQSAPTGNLFDMDEPPPPAAASPTSSPPAAHQRTSSGGAGLDSFFGGGGGEPAAPPPVAAAAPSGDLFGSPAPPTPPSDDFAAFDAFESAPAPGPAGDDFADFGTPAAPAPSPTPAPAVDDFFNMGSPAPAPAPVSASPNMFASPPAPAGGGNGGMDDLFGFVAPAPAPGPAQRGHPQASTDSAAVSAMREREAQEEALEQEKMMFVHEVEADVVKWAGEDYNPKNIRALLANFHVRDGQLVPSASLSSCGLFMTNCVPWWCVWDHRRYGRTSGGHRVVSRRC